jgi:hypothetical protein
VREPSYNPLATLRKFGWFAERLLVLSFRLGCFTARCQKA